MTLLLGLDVGTTSVKAVVYRTDGIAVSSASLPTPTHVPRPGWAYFRPDELWQTSIAAIKRAIADVDDPGRIASVAVTSMGESGVLVDARGVATITLDHASSGRYRMTLSGGDGAGEIDFRREKSN